MNKKQIEKEVNRLASLKEKLMKIKGDKSEKYFYDLSAQIDVLRQIECGRKTMYTDHIERFIRENKN